MPSLQFETPIGDCLISWAGTAITGFALLSTQPNALDPPPPWIEIIVQRVQAHLSGIAQDFCDVPLAWSRATEFQSAIYRAALNIKSGQTATYGDLARAISQPPAVSRAVGTALGLNPWPLLVPCHRVHQCRRQNDWLFRLRRNSHHIEAAFYRGE
ncbi:MAG: methylated-DNA--[protein]-cysteine S-methyltransferase [Candidatus Synoicihabitans palmerolidicus]|nr:methylated-DNA--[protein]-cysteine S-methyltransferase [Candidatus Synoicihabitans palmerolidicus]